MALMDFNCKRRRHGIRSKAILPSATHLLFLFFWLTTMTVPAALACWAINKGYYTCTTSAVYTGGSGTMYLCQNTITPSNTQSVLLGAGVAQPDTGNCGGR